MSLRHTIWRSLPGFLKPAALFGYRTLEAKHYYGAYVFRRGRAKPPNRITFEITYRCNLRCVMCPLAPSFDQKDSQIVQEWANERELTTGEITAMIDDGAALGVTSLSITGGEPFIRKDVVDIVRHAKGRRLECCVISNGTLLDASCADRLVEAGLDSLQFSVDGPEPIHGKIRQNPHAFQRTMDAARWVDQAKRRSSVNRPLVTLGCTISAANMDHLVPMVDIAHEVNASLRFGYLFYTTNEMIEQTDAILPIGHVKGENQDVPDQLKAVDPDRLYRQVCEVREKAARQHVPTRFFPDLDRSEIRRRFEDDNYSYVNKCFQPWFAVRVNPYGVVYPCSMNVEMGNVRSQPLSAIWNNQKYIDFRRELKNVKLFPKCAKCCALTNKLWDYLPKV